MTTPSSVAGVNGKYTISLQITTDDGRCDLDFHHTCTGGEMAIYAKQFAALVAAGGSGMPFGPMGGAPQAQPATKKEHKVGKRIEAAAFDCPSVVFGRATRAAPKMDTVIRGRSSEAPRTDPGSVHSAIFGEDEEDYEAAAADMQLGNFTPTAYDYAAMRH